MNDIRGPESWFLVGESSNLKNGSIQTFNLGQRKILLFRMCLLRLFFANLEKTIHLSTFFLNVIWSINDIGRPISKKLL